MTKSALAVARQALAVARDALPPYSAPTSRKTYTRHRPFAALAVRQFLGTDSRGMEQHRKDWSDLRRELALGDRVPGHTTPKRAADRLLKKGADALIAAARAGCCGRRPAPPSMRPGSTGRWSAATTPPAPAAGWPSGGGRNGRPHPTSART